jgi:glutathione S-transferase
MIQLALEEKDLPYQVKLLPPLTGKHASPELLTKNPRGTFPVLVDGAIVVYEPFAIMEYLEHAQPDPPLLPEARALRALALTRLHESHNLDEVAGGCSRIWPTRAARTSTPAEVDDLAAALHDELFFWEYYYGMGHWAAGSELTFADLAVYVHVATAVHLGLRSATTIPTCRVFIRGCAAGRACTARGRRPGRRSATRSCRASRSCRGASRSCRYCGGS